MAATTKPPPTAPQAFWVWILCLVGLDYFSTLAYQPSLAFESAGLLAPLATVVVVLATLLGVVPVYAYVAHRSPHGQGVVGLLERALPGWLGKVFILVLLGFLATDFVMTRTVSVADAAEHLIHNPQPLWQETLSRLGSKDESLAQLVPYTFWPRLVNYWNKQLIVTMLLSVLGFIFWAVFRRGFTRRVVRLAVVVVTGYLLLNAVVIGSGLVYLAGHPEFLQAWWAQLSQGYWHPHASPLPPHAVGSLALICLLSFPKMALGLSGFELSMVVMPLVRGDAADTSAEPRRRIHNVRKLLLTAALIMAVYLLGSTLVTTILIPSEALLTTGQASNRTLAYLAHGGGLRDGGTAHDLNPLFGGYFGSLYDLSTIVILCLAGASVAIGLRDFVPGYLHRLGMELDWAHRIGVILYIFNGINLVVTVIFRASVTAQRGAYATSVLVLVSSATVAAVLGSWRRRSGPWWRRLPWGFAFLSGFFLAATVLAILSKPDGLLIALAFVVAILVTSFLSRALRSTELRFEQFEFKDTQSQFLWECMKYLEFPVLVPHRPGRHSLLEKEQTIRQLHRLAPTVPLVFLEAEVGDASSFFQRPLLEVCHEEGRFLLRISRCVSVPHVIAVAALELSRTGTPPEIHCGWSEESPIEANVSFLLFGKGNVPWMVRELIRRAEPNPERQPKVIVG
jgi:hypothetical protein